MKEEAYIILEIGWEYNDEGHSNNDSYEAPKEIFFDESKAKIEITKREIQAFKRTNIMSYINDYDLTEYLTVSEETFAKFLLDTWNIEIDNYDIEIPNDASDEDIIKLLGMIKLRFFELHKIDIIK